MVAISYISLGLVAISTAVVAAPSAVDVDNKFFSHIHTHAKRSVGHSHSPHHHAHNHSKRSTTCSFPSNDGLVAVTPGSINGGWALSPDTACTAGSWCPYACPSGQLMAQWDPSATSYTYPQSQYGGLYCDDSGQVSKPFSDKPYCYDGTGTVSAVSSAGNVAFCQTVLPGNEAMLIPTEVSSGSTTLAVPDTSYWAGTAAHYYINPPGVSTDDGCVWGSTSNPWGNWSPYVAGANTDSSGTTFVKVGWNPVYLEDSSPYKNTLPSWGVNISCPDGGCTGLPCGIDPSVHGVNECYNQGTGAGGGNFCVIGVQSGKSATIEVFSSGSSSSNAKVAAAADVASSPSSASEYLSSSVAASTSTVELTASSASPASTTSTASYSSTTFGSSNSSTTSTSSTSSTSSDASSFSSASIEPTLSAVYTSEEPLAWSTEVSSSSEVLSTSTVSSSTEVAMTSTNIPDSSSSQAPSATFSFAASSAEASSVSAIVSSLSETSIGEPTTSSDSPSSTSVVVITTTVVPSSTIGFNYSSTPAYTSSDVTFAVSPSSTATFVTSLSSSIQLTNGTTLLLSTTTTTTIPTVSSSTFNPTSTISTVSRGAQYLNLDQSSTASSVLTSSSATATQSASSNSDSSKSSGSVSAGMTLHTPGNAYIAAVVLGAVLVLV
ncbi:uncharacterized protein V1513DRAFT_445735 [Lipomyces chichibuensis]|uniref:uncharacterized protein n=1 Tax=Lipomyces chichibuensis TaxID=1546026 RepID=UPI003343059A